MSVNIDCVDVDENDESQNTNDLKAPGTPEIVGTKGMRTYVPKLSLTLSLTPTLLQSSSRSTEELFRDVAEKSKRIGCVSIHGSASAGWKTRCEESCVEVSGNQTRRTLARSST